MCGNGIVNIPLKYCKQSEGVEKVSTHSENFIDIGVLNTIHDVIYFPVGDLSTLLIDVTFIQTERP